jgi:hypothetical protein
MKLVAAAGSLSCTYKTYSLMFNSHQPEEKAKTRSNAFLGTISQKLTQKFTVCKK